jgi:tRNA-Thr(GGU) m(6)t(6)A37 methyltransferase TsaA
MFTQNSEETNTYTVQPIGTVHRPESGYCLHIAPPYLAGLKQLEHFSHVIVLWWADRQDTPESRREMTCYPPYAPDKLTGVFATRAEYRPNPIGLTVCEIIALDEVNGIIQVRNVDAFEGTPILDLKGYFPVCDRVKDAHIPDWLDWGLDWLPEEGMGLYEEYEAAQTA